MISDPTEVVVLLEIVSAGFGGAGSILVCKGLRRVLGCLILCTALSTCLGPYSEDVCGCPPDQYS